MAAGACFGLAARLSRVSSTHGKAAGVLRCSGTVVNTSLLVVHQLRGSPSQISCRYAGFFNRLTANDIWQGVTGVSNPGRKRGRGKRVMKKIDLNRGQRVGDGATNMVWPGLNAPVIKGREQIRIEKLEADPRRQEKLLEARTAGKSFRSFKVPTLQRGWSGNKHPGMSCGAPDPLADYNFEGFDTKVLEFKLVANMTNNLGRKQQFSAFVVTGNKNGLAGYGLAKAPTGKAAIRKAKNVAAQRLQYVERYKDHTIYHNFYSKFMFTAVQVKKVGKGHGLVCHRALKIICEVIGIKDIHAKAEGNPGNIQNLTKAFFNGLQKQETHQELAERMKLHLVELRPERNYFPEVVASPKEGVRKTGITEEGMDFENLYFKGRVPLERRRLPPFWQRKNMWYYKWGQIHRARNQHAAQRERMVLGFEPSSKEKALRQKALKASKD